MIDARTHRFPLVVTILFAASSSLAAEPNEIMTQLTFEDSPTGLAWTHEGSPRPTHAAGITLHWSKDSRPPGAGARQDFLRYCLGGQQDISLSQQQEAFLRAVHPSWPIEIRRGRLTTAGGRDSDPNYYFVVLYAVSREDTQNMAEAYLRLATDTFRRDVRKQTDAIQRRTENITSAEKRIPELEESLATARKALEELKKQVPYRSDEQALDAIGELDRMLNAAQVEIAGIQAKMRAIQEHLQTRKQPYNEATKAKLEVMFVEEAIALRAAEARKEAATDLRAQADRFIDLNETIKNTSEEALRLRKSLPVNKAGLEGQKRQFATLKAQEPRVLDNKVFIYPVKQ